MASRFPTRQYPYRTLRAGFASGLAEDPFEGLAQGSFVRLVLGADDAPVVIATQDVGNHVNDPFARLVLAQGERPQNLLALVAILDRAAGPAALPEQRLYRVADGGQIPWSEPTAALDRHLRVVISRHRGQDAELFVSTTAPFDDDEIFLQIFSWDPQLQAYNFYERRRGIWSWAGSSWDALADGTRGLGPFDSHVNGGPVMKELKIPWLHWHSQSVRIGDEMLAPDDPLRTDGFYRSPALKGAEDLELLVRSGIARWTNARFAERIENGAIARLPEFLRQLLTTTTVNLTCSPQQSFVLGDDEPLRLPTTFFVNSELLVDELGLPAVLPRLKVPGAFYKSCLQRFAVELRDQGFVLPQDTVFAFAVPEPSLEDRMVVAELVRRGILSRRLALSILMVDFTAPVFSPRREALLGYVPVTAEAGDGSDLDRRFIAAVRASGPAGDAGTPEAELLANWDLPDDSWEASLAERLEAFWTKLSAKLRSQDGFDDIFRLAEFRRRQFRDRPLSEFGLTLALASGIELPLPLEMTEEAEVRPRQA